MNEENGGTCHSFGEAGCGCCEGVQARTTTTTPNRPGKSALHYRIGRHADFLDTMKARLSSAELFREAEAGVAAGPRRKPNPLDGLRTRDSGDASIAMLDAWATVADVLTFYQERIANEGYLRTATERRSVVELARLIGYRPRPGLAASLHLAYTIDENTRSEVVIPAGARSQSVPGPDELPQSFETSEPLPARSSWNELKPRRTLPPSFASIIATDASTGQLRVYLKGVSSNVKVGDPIVVARVDPVSGNEDGQLYRVVKVVAEPDEDRTKLELRPWAGTPVLQHAIRAAGFETHGIAADLKAMIDKAPLPGENAQNTVARLASLLDKLDAEPATILVEAFENQIEFVRKTRMDPGLAGATRLLPWLAEVEDRLTALRVRLMPAGRAMAEQSDEDPDTRRVKLLTKEPARPLPNATRLKRTLSDNFSAKSDAAFKVLGSVKPDLRDTLPTAWANYEAASTPSLLRVYALRLKAGLFGHNFPPRQRTTTTRRIDSQGTNLSTDETETEVIGEHQIVLDAEPFTESENVIYLDASYDGIIPGSWIALDFTAVKRFEEGAEDHQVEPATFHSSQDPLARPPLLAHVVSVTAKISRAEYGGSGDTTRLEITPDWITIVRIENLLNGIDRQELDNNDFQVIRGTAVFAQSEELELAEQPIADPVCFANPAMDYIELDGFYADLESGRFVIVSGERTDIPETKGVLAAELGMVVDVIHAVRQRDTPDPVLGTEDPPDEGEEAGTGSEDTDVAPLPGDRVHTFIRLDKPLAYCYERDSVTIRANVVRATHGETRKEVLGSGDGSKPFASFDLKQRPLTYVSAPTPDGIESTLEVFVDGVRWKHVPDFLGRGPRDHVYTTRTDDDDRTTVLFGDGHTGARTPTGVENLAAVYRNGIGRAGNVRAGQVSLLQSRPLGVKEVINPLRASGGTDRESRDQARSNAPLAVQSLDRLVSVADYADFARTFAGIGKAVAAELSDGRQTVVHVTIAGADDAPIDRESDLFANLRKALREFGDPFQPIALDVRELLLLVIEARLKILPDHQWEVVSPAVRSALVQTFGFGRRELGQDVARSEIIAAMQAVRGVDWVDLDTFGAFSTSVPDAFSADGLRPATPDEIGQAVRVLVDEQRDRPPRHRIAVELARPGGAGILPAQLAVLAPDLPATLVLNQIT